MCHVSRSQCELVDAGSELGVDSVKGFLEGSWDGAVAWQGCGETGTEETVVDPGEEEGGTEAGSVRGVQQKPLRRVVMVSVDVAITGSFGEDAHHDQEAG